MNSILKSTIATTALAAAALFHSPDAGACSRVIYHGLENQFIVGRSLDWKTPIPTNLYVYPRGMQKVSSDRAGAISWTSRYGAVYAVSYDGGITEGMNEKGLVINGLFCKGTVYENAQTAGRPPMSLAVFVAWMLDTHETTDEVVATLKKHDFNISGQTFDGGTVSALHWGITDASGKTAICEFDNGNIKIYDPGDYWAMTNDPTWPQMTAIIDYWAKKGGKNTLPGTVSSPDRCVRANFFAHNVQQTADPQIALSIIRSILFNVSVPYHYTVEGDPNVSSTQWRSFADLKNCRYYFDVVTSDGIYYIDLNKCDLRPGASVMKLTASECTQVCGEANRYLRKVPPFTPMY